jgi:Domain of unknown function (DUF5703)
MKYKIFSFFLALVCANVNAQTINSNYNIVWHEQSKNAGESMSCGGGDIGMNVWVENGELLIYIARSGSFNEDNAMMKTGRIRIKLFPNPFIGKIFKQELHVQEGYVSVAGEGNGVKANIKIWADVFKPIAYIEIDASQKINVEAAYESWRYQDRVVKAKENFGNSYKWAAPKNNVYKKDVINFNKNEVLFYHYNTAETIFDITVAQQGMNSVKNELYNPLRKLASGGSFGGNNFVPAGTYEAVYADTDFKAWKIKSSIASKKHLLNLYLHTAQVENIKTWKNTLDSLKKKSQNISLSFYNTQLWWKQFWNRSFVEIDKANINGKAWEIGRNFTLFRYMLACNAKGNWPTKFNGGLLTVDPVFTDTSKQFTPDFRNWGGGLHAMQNQRLVYFPMIKNGDWDMLQSQLEFYFRILKNAELRTKVYWNHGGACFTEQMENFGLPNYAEYGQKRPAYFDKGVEYNEWLKYEWDTVFEFCLMLLEEENYTGKDIGKAIPFIESCLQFFDEHYQYIAKQNRQQALDENGKLILYPGSAAETYKMAFNSTSTIAALQTITKRLLALQVKYLNTEKRKYWQEFLLRIPEISYATFDGHTIIAPAKSWEKIKNTESPQLYPVYPWGIFGVGKNGLDTALNTWHYDTSVIKFRSHIGWKQDNIFAARLGLTEEAWRLTSLKLQNAENKFPAFWGPGFDWLPDHNWGGSGMIGLQEMLIQTDNRKIFLFPAWPKNIDVHFKLHAPYNTIVEAEMKKGKMVMLKVLPAERGKDIVFITK